MTQAKRKIVAFIKQKVRDSKTDGVVLGLSGSIDSAVTAYLSVEALGNRRVHGLVLPDQRVTPESDISDAKVVAEELCIETRLIDIAPIHRAFMKNLAADKLAEGNLQDRIRMSIIYYRANSMNRLVAGTGDKSELSLGHFTKYGDSGVDILPIGDLYKTEVRRLGEALGISRRIISKRISPWLWQGRTVEGELGLTDDVIDEILKLYFEERLSPKSISSRIKLDANVVERILTRCRESAHKRESPEICKIR
ncbi:MAG: NAD+ synthase [Thaumarchaeota archaeon]|nr:NAD+ synthase [Nitrososphaerota archaeon]